MKKGIRLVEKGESPWCKITSPEAENRKTPWGKLSFGVVFLRSLTVKSRGKTVLFGIQENTFGPFFGIEK